MIACISYRGAKEPGGELEDRVWSAPHMPRLDAAGAVAFILQHTVDASGL